MNQGYPDVSKEKPHRPCPSFFTTQKRLYKKKYGIKLITKINLKVQYER
jgi:hypothetical protein